MALESKKSLHTSISSTSLHTQVSQTLTEKPSTIMPPAVAYTPPLKPDNATNPAARYPSPSSSALSLPPYSSGASSPLDHPHSAPQPYPPDAPSSSGSSHLHPLHPTMPSPPSARDLTSPSWASLSPSRSVHPIVAVAAAAGNEL